MNKILYIDFDTGQLIDSEGAILLSTPTISYQAEPNWELHFVRIAEDGTLSGADLTSAVSWNSAVDTDFTTETDPMIRTLPSAIISDDAVSGVIITPLDANTETFFDKVDGKNSINAYFEIRGRDSEDKVIYDYRFRINALGAIDPLGGEPLPIASGGVTISDVYALLRAGVEYQFSEDGNSWHSTQTSADLYYQSRYPEGAWGEAIAMISGTPGTNGEDGQNGTNGIGFTIIGEYDADTVYNPPSSNYEVVTYNGSTYAYINEASASGQTPPTSAISDSYWRLLAAKGDPADITTISATNVTGLTEYISGVISGEYAKVGDSYTIAQANALLADKADADDVYTKTEADNLFIDEDELTLATSNLVTVSQWNAQNTTFQTEIDYLSGQISGGGGGDLSNYTPLSTTQSVSAYLQSEIVEISGSGGGGSSNALTGVNLNNEALNVTDKTVNITALPIATTMPTPQNSKQNFMLYLGTTDDGDSYVGDLRSYEILASQTSYLDLSIADSSASGTNRVWTGQGYMDTHYTIKYTDSAWGLWQWYNSIDDDGTKIADITTPAMSGQPWGNYTTILSKTYTFLPPDYAAASKCHLYEKADEYDDQVIIFNEDGTSVETALIYTGGSPSAWYLGGDTSLTTYLTITATSGDFNAWTYNVYESEDSIVHQYYTGFVSASLMPWDLSDVEWTDHSDSSVTTFDIRKVYRGRWNDLGKITS